MHVCSVQFSQAFDRVEGEIHYRGMVAWKRMEMNSVLSLGILIIRGLYDQVWVVVGGDESMSD